MVALHVPVSVHVAALAVVIAVAVPVVAPCFLPKDCDNLGVGPVPVIEDRSSLAAWLEPRTLLIGLVALTFAVAEGAGNNWVSVSIIDDHRAAPAVGALSYAMFLAALTVARWLGPEFSPSSSEPSDNRYSIDAEQVHVPRCDTVCVRPSDSMTTYSRRRYRHSPPPEHRHISPKATTDVPQHGCPKLSPAERPAGAAIVVKRHAAGSSR